MAEHSHHHPGGKGSSPVTTAVTGREKIAVRGEKMGWALHGRAGGRSKRYIAFWGKSHIAYFLKFFQIKCGQSLKHFFKFRLFVPAKLLQPSLMFMFLGMIRSLPYSGAPKRCPQPYSKH